MCQEFSQWYYSGKHPKKAIDIMVYELYGLSEKEISIVENS